MPSARLYPVRPATPPPWGRWRCPRIDGFIHLLAGGRSSAHEAVICGDCGIDLVASEYATLNEVKIAIGVSLSERARQCQHHLCMRCLAMAHANRGAELTIHCGCGCKSPSWIIHARWQRGQIRDEVQRIVAPTEYHERCRHPHLFFQNTSCTLAPISDTKHCQLPIDLYIIIVF